MGYVFTMRKMGFTDTRLVTLGQKVSIKLYICCFSVFIIKISEITDTMVSVILVSVIY